MTARVEQVSGHLAASTDVFGAVGKKSPSDIVVVAALRTPITRAKGGGLQGMQPEEVGNSSGARLLQVRTELTSGVFL
jgi:acetyl-CoA acyltransferase 1